MTPTKGQTAFDWGLFANRVKVLKHYRETGEFIDGILESEEGVMLPVHMVVISGLGEQVTNFMNETHVSTELVTPNGKMILKRIQFPGVNEEALKTLVDCAYTGELQTDAVRIWEVLEVAERCREARDSSRAVVC